MNIFNKKEQQEDNPLHIFDKKNCSRISNFCEVKGVSAKLVIDAVKLGNWADVEKLKAENVQAEDALNGLIIKGYETKFGKTNENGERYDKDCLDNFIERYYVKNKLNIPVTIQHRDDIEHLAGRVLLVEVNTVGFYFVVYIPRTYRHYEDVLNNVREGILQGMSKEGYASWEYIDFVYKKDGSFDYMVIKEFDLTAMSLVAIPANAVPFEKTQIVKNAVQFHKNNSTTNNAEENPMHKMFH